MKSDEVLKTISQDTPSLQVHFCYIFSAIVECIRNYTFMLSTNEESCNVRPVDIRGVVFSVKKQMDLLSEHFSGEMREYFLVNSQEEGLINLVIKQMKSAGEICDLSNGKYILSPYKFIDIGCSNKAILQGGITEPSWLRNKSCILNGVTRLVDKSKLMNKIKARTYDLQNWIQLPYGNHGLIEWTNSIIDGLDYKSSITDSQMEVFHPRAHKWVKIDEIVKKDAYEYALGRLLGKGYSYWVLKKVGSGKYEAIASLEKECAVRFMYGIEALNHVHTKAHFYLDKDIVYLRLPNRLPSEEAKVLYAMAYPWPCISKKVYRWFFSKDIWEILYKLLTDLGISVCQVDDLNKV